VSQRRRRAPERRPSATQKKLSIRVFTEGQKTEPIYLTHWYRLHRDRVVVSISEFHGTPLPLVETAVAEMERDARAARRGRGDAYNHYWCVFDTDIHPRIPEALELARRHNVQVALSNPCIELWFLLHFETQTAYLERDEAQHRAQALGCEKNLTPAALSALEDLHGEAVERSKALEARHRGNGSPPGSNPSSTVWRLIEVIRSA
jgi:hypothetical protein